MARQFPYTAIVDSRNLASQHPYPLPEHQFCCVPAADFETIPTAVFGFRKGEIEIRFAERPPLYSSPHEDLWRPDYFARIT